MHKPEFSCLMRNPASLFLPPALPGLPLDPPAPQPRQPHPAPKPPTPPAPPGREAPYPQGFSAALCPYRAARASSTRTVAGASAGSGSGTCSS